jgi:glyoxylase-like metal-dependent hydrolase (beta-lactamase superfamily II)
MAARIDTVRIGVTNVYILRDRGTVMIDPAAPVRSTEAPRSVVEALGLPPRLDLMVVTHAHFDHVGACLPLRRATRAPIAVHRRDAEWLRAGKAVWPTGVTAWGKFIRSVIGVPVMPLVRMPTLEPDILVDDEGLDLAPYGIEGRVVHTPGHTPGSLSIVLPTGEAFVGDLAMNGAPMCLRPRFGIFAHEPDIVPGSWRRLLAMGVRTVYPAHGRPFPASALPA